MNYRYHPEARVESVKTFERYESEQEGLGSRFVEALDATIERIMNDPESYAFIASETRSLSVSRFPYSVVYRVECESQEVVIYAVAHASRRQGYWRHRMSPE